VYLEGCQRGNETACYAVIAYAVRWFDSSTFRQIAVDVHMLRFAVLCMSRST
jgi:hypothetical protein